MSDAGFLIPKIKQILLKEWDPIGVHDVPQARDEYDSYTGEIAAMLTAGASPQLLARKLVEIETQAMGLSPRRIRAGLVARKLSLLVDS